MRAKCRCNTCGEILTAPIFFDGKIYGYSCIKKVNPKYKKTKEYRVEADNYTVEETDNELGIVANITANYKGITHRDEVIRNRYSTGEVKEISTRISIVDGKAYIDLLKYKRGIF